MKVIIFADGGSRGNPGVAGSGTVVYAADGTTVLREIVYVVGTSATNNVAEYHGLLRGVEAAAQLGATEVEVHMDSKLVVEQMSGRWKIKHPDMQKLAVQARGVIANFETFSISWVPRARNKVADALSNDAMDACASGHPVGIVGAVEAAPAESADAAPPAESADAGASASKAAANPGWLGERGAVLRLILLRHGQTEPNTRQAYSGRTDVELTELGHRQAQAAGRELAAGRWGSIDKIVTSPLQRCQDTAQAVRDALVAAGSAPDVVTEPDLIELDFGAWEGLTLAQAQQRDPQAHAQWMEDAAAAPPEGESLQQLHRRVRALRRRLEADHPGQTLLLVSHVNPIKSLVRQALDAGPVCTRRMHLDSASISVVEFWDGGALVRGVNDTSHLR
ncbi:bifunctional RNase H/acid phosphatase [Corynebacterium lizhenjunii]|uniref:Bifunctional RNase H/acid phosphatase n=1 Tax=Corynebacterium lizhenjunii TaxID=2709394 RepID=A0A7T0KEN2_9CORY|nr:bifunctional RNase H/acid phosphatase [Corynebacterium lizhenjunii]QPK78559.1 bifunctional RNase H/acid phosphatase [Corynebacterium lizhenjunii]